MISSRAARISVESVSESERSSGETLAPIALFARCLPASQSQEVSFDSRKATSDGGRERETDVDESEREILMSNPPVVCYSENLHHPFQTPLGAREVALGLNCEVAAPVARG